MATRKRASRPSPRDRLVEATLSLIPEIGIHALTTVAITKRAAVSQPNFYAHFKNIDACMEAAAEEISKDFVALNATAFEALSEAIQAGRAPREVTTAYYDHILEKLMKHRRIAELFFRHRDSDTPFGRVMGRLQTRQVEWLSGWLFDLGAPLGLEGKHLPEVRLLAEFHIAMTAAAVMALFEERQTDRTGVAEALAANATATIRATFKRLLKSDES